MQIAHNNTQVNPGPRENKSLFFVQLALEALSIWLHAQFAGDCG
jgi:hypothetical protein